MSQKGGGSGAPLVGEATPGVDPASGAELARALGLALGLALALIAPPLARAAERPLRFDVEPGPTRMSAEERAIAPDPESGAAHGVVLLERKEWDQSLGTPKEFAFHRRAKILSKEGFDLGEVYCPSASVVELVRWWARTIHPDGRIDELVPKELAEEGWQEVGGWRWPVRRGRLPRLEPGVIVDWGFEVEIDEDFLHPVTERFQGKYPLRRGLLRWRPNERLGAGWWTREPEGRQIRTHRGRGQVVFEVNDLPAIVDEPFMPPYPFVYATALAYHKTLPESDPKAYWDAFARLVSKELERFLRPETPLRRAAREAPRPEAGDFAARMGALYDWLLNRVEAPSRGVEARRQVEDDAHGVLEAGIGGPREIDGLFIGLARQLGAEAWPLYVLGRDEGYFFHQTFNHLQILAPSLVALRPEGAPDEPWIICDPSSRLSFGELLPEYIGVVGTLFKARTHELVEVPIPDARANARRVRGRVSHDDGQAGLALVWREERSGLAALETRRGLAGSGKSEREHAEALCGRNEAFVVRVAELGALEDQRALLTIDCGGETSAPRIDEESASYALGIEGPYKSQPPVLDADERVHPIVFDYPLEHHSLMTFESAPGFVATSPPPPVTIENAFGSYTLSIERSAEGYVVERRFVLDALVIGAERYPAFREFLRQVEEHDRTSLDFTRVESSPQGGA